LDSGRLPKVATEMALHVLAYNLTRVMNIVGIQPLREQFGLQAAEEPRSCITKISRS
jgi:hypothetical protein